MNDKILSLFETLFSKMWEWIIGPFKDLKSLKTLIYGDPNNALVYGVFKTDTFEDVIAPGMATMQALAFTIILIAILMAGMKISSSGINPSNRTYAIEFFKDILIVGLLLFNLGTIFDLIFTANSAFVSSFSSAKELLDMDKMSSMITFNEQGVLGNLILGLCLLGLWLWANFYYMMRSLTLIILMIMSPLACAFYLIPQTRGITGGIFKEFTGTVFVQSVHAGLYWVVCSIVANESGIGSILLYIIFIPVSEMIRSLLGLGGQMNDRMTKTAAMFGGSALMGVAGAVKGAINGQSVTSALKGMAGNVLKKGGSQGGEENSSGILSNAGTDIGTTSKAERMLKAGEITSKMGKAVFGAAGAIAGAPMGPMGSITGSTIGASAGGVVGGVAGRAGMATVEFAGKQAIKGIKSGAKKGQEILQAEKLADEKLANSIADMETTQWASENKDAFIKDMKNKFPDVHDQSINQLWDKEVASKKGEFLTKARGTVGEIKKADNKLSKADSLVQSSVDNLTNDWAKNNKEQFMKDFDQTHPLSANPTEGEIQKHKEAKTKAWDDAITNKKAKISHIANETASNMSKGIPLNDSYINKEDFVKDMANNVSGVIGKDSRQSLSAMKKATQGTKTESVYNRTSANTEMITGQLATVKTNQAKFDYINSQKNIGVSEEQALAQWQGQEKQVYQNNLQSVASTIPRHIPLKQAIVRNTGGRVLSAIGGGLVSGVVGASGVKEVSEFLTDTKLGQSAVGVVNSVRTNRVDPSQGVITGVGNYVKTIGTAAKDGFVNHVPTNVVEKQAGFRNAVAYTTGVIGGVSGYKAGASFASGGGQKVFSNSSGGFGFNPYNSAVNKQVAEISEIEHMAQTITDQFGNQVIAEGAVRMVTTQNDSFIEVRDKTGQTQIVSRKGAGDSSLNRKQVVYQDLTITNGTMSAASPVYQEDSGGGKINLNRTLNINPNKLVANRNTTGRNMVTEVPSYNQMVDSGQYHMNDIIHDVQQVRMVVDRNRSYLVGKDQFGKDYRVSSYGPGDPRLENNKVIYSDCEVRNNKLVNSNSFYELSNEGQETPYEHTTSLKAKDLIPSKPNKRAEIRRKNEMLRTESFTESLR